MPELPEVETIRRGLAKKIIGKKIIDIDVRYVKSFVGDKKNIIGAKVKDVKRKSKILQIDFRNNCSLLVHLKMTGQLIYQKKGEKLVGGHPQKIYEQPSPHKHTHVIYTFNDGAKLYFNDLRKFGWNKLVKTSDIEKIFGNKFGPEPFDSRSGQASKGFTVDYLKNIFSRSRKAIKLVLMDQEKISGVGNIYANDALYLAGILPTRSANSLTDKEISKLKKAIEKAIALGIKHGGSSENTYVNIEGKKGSYMKVAAVYKQEKDPKGHKLERIKLGGRGTFYCKICQK